MTRRDVLLMALAIAFVGGAILLQYSQNNIPGWLISAITGIVTYYFGYQTIGNNGSDE